METIKSFLMSIWYGQFAITSFGAITATMAIIASLDSRTVAQACIIIIICVATMIACLLEGRSYMFINAQEHPVRAIIGLACAMLFTMWLIMVVSAMILMGLFCGSIVLYAATVMFVSANMIMILGQPKRS